MNKEQLYETIEAYLEGTLTAEAHRAFEKEIAADRQLKTEVALHQKMHQELSKSAKAQLRAQLHQIGQEFPLERKRRTTISWLIPVSGALAAAILAGVIWWVLPRFDQSPAPQGPAIVSDEAPSEPTAVVDSLIAVEPPPKQQEEAPPIQQQKPSTTPPAADPYRPNPKLEGLIASEKPDPNFLISADANTAQTTAENFRATVSGTLRSALLADDANIQIQIYDNQPASYLKERPAAAIPLELQRLEGDEETLGLGKMKNYTFEKEVEKELPPGLYYYVIKREGEDAPLFIGKVEVRKED